MELETKKRRINLDLIGQKFQRLTVVELSEKRIYNGRVWKCLCDCGSIVEKRQSGLLCGDAKSCGCLTYEKNRAKKIKPKGESTRNTFFLGYTSDAKKRNINFDLTFDECIKISQQNCNYCGIAPSTIIKSEYDNGDFVYNGIDRVDNNLGYVSNNVVACCIRCNKAKWTLHKNEFLSLVKTIYEKHCI